MQKKAALDNKLQAGLNAHILTPVPVLYKSSNATYYIQRTDIALCELVFCQRTQGTPAIIHLSLQEFQKMWQQLNI